MKISSNVRKKIGRIGRIRLIKKNSAVLMQGGVLKAGSNKRSVVLGALFLDELDEALQVGRIDVGQNAVTEVEDVA